VEIGSILSDLFLLVGGIAEIHSGLTNRSSPLLKAGDFIGEIGFFTESPQIHSVLSVTVCKTLTMSRSTYKLLAQDYPGSIGKVLQNLLTKVERTAMQAHLPRSIEELRVGSNIFYMNDNQYSTHNNIDEYLDEEHYFNQRSEALIAVKDLVKMHIERNHDDETTRLLFAASRGDTRTISLMCDHGFDPNSHDYDHRTALMVASMKGNADVVRLLLQYNANPNITDMHGSSALLEAAKNGHDDILSLLVKSGASLCMSDSQAASVLCQAVFDGDILLIKRLLKGNINFNAGDYDKRTASHIAAAEGNIAAIRILAEHGADLFVADRWGNTVKDEAIRCNARQLVAFLDRKEIV
jgi:ankyrin repeat protein